MKYLIGICCLFALFVACDDDDAGTICTEEFVSVGFTIDGDPAPAEVTTFFKDAMPPSTRVLEAQNGFYTIVDDSDQEALGEGEFTYVVEGTDSTGATLFSEEYVISVDECHVGKVSGPEVISY